MTDNHPKDHTLEKCPQEPRLKTIETDSKNTLVQFTGLAKDVSYIKTAVDKIEKRMDDNYVLKSDFNPIQKIVYGMVALILTAVVIALISLVVKNGV